MRAPERTHKRPHNDERGSGESYCVLVVADGESRPEPRSRTSGTSCMTTISTQRPIAVSIVAGRVRNTGVGLCARRSPDMADTPKLVHRKTAAKRPRIMGQACKNHTAGAVSTQGKCLNHNELAIDVKIQHELP